MTNDGNRTGKTGRGFAGMDPERQREIASEGGRAAHQSGNAHQFTPEEAREAGRKGGQASRGNTQDDGNEDGERPSRRRGSSEQPTRAGQQSHKND